MIQIFFASGDYAISATRYAAACQRVAVAKMRTRHMPPPLSYGYAIHTLRYSVITHWPLSYGHYVMPAIHMIHTHTRLPLR